MRSHLSFLDSLKKVLEIAKQSNEIKVEQIFLVLEKRGLSALIVLFSLPFTFPIMIPGVSTPFGIFLGFLGTRLMLSKPLWCPKWLGKKTFSSQSIVKLITKTISVFKYMQRFLKPRLEFLTTKFFFDILNGLLIFILALILSLPLPVPLSNILTGFPLLFFGLGLLEKDGVFILIAYLLSVICFAAFFGLFLIGKAEFFSANIPLSLLN